MATDESARLSWREELERGLASKTNPSASTTSSSPPPPPVPSTSSNRQSIQMGALANQPPPPPSQQPLQHHAQQPQQPQQHLYDSRPHQNRYSQQALAGGPAPAPAPGSFNTISGQSDLIQQQQQRQQQQQQQQQQYFNTVSSPSSVPRSSMITNDMGQTIPSAHPQTVNNRMSQLPSQMQQQQFQQQQQQQLRQQQLQQQPQQHSNPSSRPVSPTAQLKAVPRHTPPGIHDMNRLIHLFSSRKFYAEGYVYKRVQQSPDGRILPTSDPTAIWDKWYCQLIGNELSMWNAKQMEEAASKGTTVPPQYLRVSDSHVIPASPKELADGHPNYRHGFVLNNAGINRLLFAVEDQEKLFKWINMLRLSEWEYARLQDMFTATLLGDRHLESAPSPLKNGHLEGHLDVRAPGENNWTKCFVVLSAATPPGSIKSRRRTSVLSALNIGSKDNKDSGDEFANLSIYATKKSKKPFLQIRDVYYCAAVYPQLVKLIGQTTIFRLEGTCFWDDSAELPKSLSGSKVRIDSKTLIGRDGGRTNSENSIFFMPSEQGASSQVDMLHMIVAVCDAFQLYGRGSGKPFSFSPFDPDSPYFAYPNGPYRENLFLSTAACTNLEINQGSPHMIKQSFHHLLKQRMAKVVQASKNPQQQQAQPTSPPPPQQQQFNNQQSPPQSLTSPKQQLSPVPSDPVRSPGNTSSNAIPPPPAAPGTAITTASSPSASTATASPNLSPVNQSFSTMNLDEAISAQQQQQKQNQDLPPPPQQLFTSQQRPSHTPPLAQNNPDANDNDNTNNTNNFSRPQILAPNPQRPPHFSGPPSVSPVSARDVETPSDANNNHKPSPVPSSNNGVYNNTPPVSTSSPSNNNNSAAVIGGAVAATGFAATAAAVSSNPASSSSHKPTESEQQQQRMVHSPSPIKEGQQQQHDNVPAPAPAPAPANDYDAEESEKHDNVDEMAKKALSQESSGGPAKRESVDDLWAALNFVERSQPSPAPNVTSYTRPRLPSKKHSADSGFGSSKDSDKQQKDLNINVPPPGALIEQPVPGSPDNYGDSPTVDSFDQRTNHSDNNTTTKTTSNAASRTTSTSRVASLKRQGTELTETSSYSATSVYSRDTSGATVVDSNNPPAIPEKSAARTPSNADETSASLPGTAVTTTSSSNNNNTNNNSINASTSTPTPTVSASAFSLPRASTSSANPSPAAFGGPSKRAEERAQAARIAQQAQEKSRNLPGRQAKKDSKPHDNGDKKGKDKNNKFTYSDDDEDEDEDEESEKGSNENDSDNDIIDKRTSTVAPLFISKDSSSSGSTQSRNTANGGNNNNSQLERQPSATKGPRPIPGNLSNSNNQSRPNSEAGTSAQPHRSLPVPPQQQQQMDEQQQQELHYQQQLQQQQQQMRQSQMLNDDMSQYGHPSMYMRQSWDPRASGFYGSGGPSPSMYEGQFGDQQSMMGGNRNNETFLNFNEPSEAAEKAHPSQQFDANGVPIHQGFMPHGLLTQHNRAQQEKSAKELEATSRETGAPLLDVPRKPPPPQTGLVGAIASHERDKKERGGIQGQLMLDRQREMMERQQRAGHGNNMSMDGRFSQFGGNPAAGYGSGMMMPPYGMGMNMNPMQMQMQMQAMYAAQQAYMAAMQNHMGSQMGSPRRMSMSLDNEQQQQQQQAGGSGDDQHHDQRPGSGHQSFPSGQFGTNPNFPMGMPAYSMPPMNMGMNSMMGVPPYGGYMSPDMMMGGGPGSAMGMSMHQPRMSMSGSGNGTGNGNVPPGSPSAVGNSSPTNHKTSPSINPQK